jgi:hypothetical protein
MNLHQPGLFLIIEEMLHVSAAEDTQAVHCQLGGTFRPAVLHYSFELAGLPKDNLTKQ